MIVVDASVLAPALGDDGLDGDLARGRLLGETLAAPELIDLEIASVLRRSALAGRLDGRRAQQALIDLNALPLQRVPHRPLLPRIWELRENHSVYDAAYLALAEAAGAALLTADSGLASSAIANCEIELIRRRRPRT